MDSEKQKPITDDYRRGWNRIFGPVAQLAERDTHNAKVSGSIPDRPTTYLNGYPIMIDDKMPIGQIDVIDRHGRRAIMYNIGPQRDDL